MFCQTDNFWLPCLKYLLAIIISHTVLGSVLRMLLTVSKQNFNFGSVDLVKREISHNFNTCPSTFSKEKGRVMSGIGGGAFYLFCFEELRCEFLEQCSSKRFVEER